MSNYTTSTGNILAGWVTNWGTNSTPGYYVNSFTLRIGEISELAIQAIFSTSTVYPKYTYISGMPSGLTLYRDGTIGGRPNNIRTNLQTSTFYASVVDQNNNVLLGQGGFTITLVRSTSSLYTTVFAKPLLTQQKRQEFNNFINDPNIFIPSMIYRKFDPNFGVQKELKLYIEHGLRKTTYSSYFTNIANPARTKISLEIGKIKTAIGKDYRTGVITYEIIYLNVNDKHSINSRVGVPSSIVINGVTYYPPSILNIRAAEASTTDKTNIREPTWANTIQPNESVSPEYNYSIPICFTLPGKSAIVLRKIQESGFKFNTIKYDIDRFIIESTLEGDGYVGERNKYIALPRDSGLA